MSIVGQPESVTQRRVIELFKDELGYRFLGDFSDRENSNIEAGIITDWLKRRGQSEAEIGQVIHRLRTEAGNIYRSLYDNNQIIYNLLRYGVPVQTRAAEHNQTVWLVDWQNPEENDFAIAEEVTLRGAQERRPDLVLYLNGIAIGVVELKSSRVSIGQGIRQLLSNQRPEYNEDFFRTVQIVMAGNDSEGFKYGTIGTPEKMFLEWKEDVEDNSRFKLDKYLLKICNKPRLIELLHDFVLFDGGIKKLPRVHQYFGIKAAQASVNARKSGIIWHTQGSGKSIVMVLLAKWILENNPHARVVIITDRDELDKQIEKVFNDAGEKVKRSKSGQELLQQLGQASPRLLCSLVHKFGPKKGDSFEEYLKGLKDQPSNVEGELFVFVDECHRTQSGKFNEIMKALLPDAVFIGFTGTPLLRKDKKTSIEVFGRYIHTYTFSEAVEDGVVLDLLYEARDIDQRLGSEDKIDAWFEIKTRGLNDWQKEELKKQWGTMQNVLSSKSRIGRIVADITFDFSVKPRLVSQRGNAMLVVSSILDACRYFKAFQETELRDRCAIVTSYNPLAKDVSKEETGANTETDRQFIYKTYTELLTEVVAKAGKSKTETYEDEAKQRFVKEPARMKLLIVVDKLLTGFDAPPCTYLYIDKRMQDHGLFQAICRTNRLDGEDKPFGFIVDYMDLFNKVKGAIDVYTSELDHEMSGVDPDVMVHDRLEKGRERLDGAIEALSLICEPVQPPRGTLEYIHYFCGNTEIPEDLAAHEPQRVALYKGVVGLIRAFANIADEMPKAGYSVADVERIKKLQQHYLDVREVVRLASHETLDLKAYEADMRYLIDTYIDADEPRKISPFESMGLLDVIVKSGIGEAVASLPEGIRSDKTAVAEVIENNVRKKITKESLNDPAFYARMSELLDELIKYRRMKAEEYEEYLKRIAELAAMVNAGKADDTPAKLDSPGKRALWNNLGKDLTLALRIDEAVKSARPDEWRGNLAREQTVKRALYDVLKDEAEVERVFPIIRAQREY